ncbi:type VI secretion system membrane subunit TssM [Thalassolituus sp.]|uniref:type VI secretion system membrane subunit TssM n=1 Tax=Thalassolituus sp. TaxID=2030822 RepID=UPI002A8041E7|nr:type VI secretion system membrane subunit TssM [Thalassolituus sp.]
MKRLLEFLTNKWVLGIIGLTALSLLIWFGAEFIKFGSDNVTLSTTTRWIVIGLFWLIWLTWNMAQWLVERRQNKELIGSIEESQEEAKNPDDERSQEELTAMSQRFREALATLKKTRFKSRFGSRSLYQLPWYIIIGPPGAGKTTALINSGLNFPLAESHGKQALGGVGGTRNCDWWFTNDAVLIDTAGRYTTQDSHRVVDNNAWNAFLTLLKKYRRRRPINGALIAISLQDLMVQTAEQRNQQAKTIKTRIGELQEELGVRFPVYLTFTKCDLVAGFAEFFANLSQSEREQVWGVSFPAETSPETGADIGRFKAEFSELAKRLNGMLLGRVHQERNIEKRSMIQSFPAHFESLGGVVDEFVAQVFSPDRFGSVPMLRGVYFTSATQEGSPIDRMMAQVSNNFGLERNMGKQQQNSGKSFFITRLFNDVIFPESELVGVNRKVENILLWLRRGTLAVFSLIFLGSAALWAGGLTKNKSFMTDVDAFFYDFKQQAEKFDVTRDDIPAVLPVMNPLLNASLVYDQDEHPFLSNLGLYDGRVDSSADALYQVELNKIFFPAVKTMLERHLNTLTYTDSELLPIFKVYLMLFDEEHRDYQQIRAYAKTRWQDMLPGEAGKQEQLLRHLDNLFGEPLNTEVVANDQVVERTRLQLKRIPVAQRLYAQLQNSGNNAQLVDLYREIGGDTQQAFGIAETDPVFKMPFLFTKAGFKNAEYGANSDMMTKIAEDRWIYGDGANGEDFTKADLEKLSDEVEKLYLSEYAKRWQAFYQRFTLSRITNSIQAIAVLQQLSDPIASPLVHVSELVAENTSLTPQVSLDPSKGAVAGAAAKVFAKVYEPNIVDLRFQDVQRMVKSENGVPSKMQSYLLGIQQLNEYFRQINSAPDSNAAAFDVAKTKFTTNGADAMQQLKSLAATAPEQAQGWLNHLANSTWTLIVGKAKTHIDTVWRYQVYDNYRENIYNRYPMSADKKSEATVIAFDEFFKPGGIQQSFVDEYVLPFVDTRRWQAKSYDGLTLGISNASLAQFRRADNIRKAFYAKGESAGFAFAVEPHKLDSNVRLFTLEVGESRMSYSHGPRIEKDAMWSAAESNRSRVVFEDLNEAVSSKQFDGDWSFLRLLDDADMKATSNAREYSVTFTGNGHNAVYNLIAPSSVNAFDFGLLRNFSCPQSL